MENTPAARIIALIGGHTTAAKICRVALSSVYRWTYPATKGGLGGIIPHRHASKILEYAARKKIRISAQDFFAKTPKRPARLSTAARQGRVAIASPATR
jgi:hypothetical protein